MATNQGAAANAARYGSNYQAPSAGAPYGSYVPSAPAKTSGGTVSSSSSGGGSSGSSTPSATQVGVLIQNAVNGDASATAQLKSLGMTDLGVAANALGIKSTNGTVIDDSKVVNSGTTYAPTGLPNLDALQAAYASWISGSLADGYKINPGLSINESTVGQFITETANQLHPQFQQALTNEITNTNSVLGNAVTKYLASQGQTVQDFQAGLGSQRNYAGANGMYMGGGENAIEEGLKAKSQRTLDTTASDYQTAIGQTLRDSAGKVGQGFAGANNVFGQNVAGVNGSVSSFIMPTDPLTGLPLANRSLSLQGGNSVYSGTADQGKALDYNYNPSTYQYGSIPGQFATDFSSLLNTTGSNYLKQQQAGGVYNVTNAYAKQLGITQ